MELLTIILLIIIGILAFLLLKKERVLGIKTDENKTEEQVKVIESKDYRKNIYDLLNYIPEGIICLLYTSPSPRDRQKSRMPSSA